MTVSFLTTTEVISGIGVELKLYLLQNLQQYFDPEGTAAAQGFSEETWSLFGVVWPSARVLAKHLASYPITGQRILEVGCGLALGSLVLHQRGANVTASDCHPLVPQFLNTNLALNGLKPMPYCAARWEEPNESLGRFELIVGSDVLYERGQAGVLSRFLDRHLEAHGQVILVDPNRSQRSAFNKDMEALGFSMEWSAVDAAPGLDAPYRGRLLRYTR
jgi:predicted nicotinamide N-methyase